MGNRHISSRLACAGALAGFLAIRTMFGLLFIVLIVYFIPMRSGRILIH